MGLVSINNLIWNTFVENVLVDKNLCSTIFICKKCLFQLCFSQKIFLVQEFFIENFFVERFFSSKILYGWKMFVEKNLFLWKNENQGKKMCSKNYLIRLFFRSKFFWENNVLVESFWLIKIFIWLKNFDDQKNFMSKLFRSKRNCSKIFW